MGLTDEVTRRFAQCGFEIATGAWIGKGRPMRLADRSERLGSSRQLRTGALCLCLILAGLEARPAIGQSLSITEFQIDPEGRMILRFPADKRFYYLLLRGDRVT